MLSNKFLSNEAIGIQELCDLYICDYSVQGSLGMPLDVLEGDVHVVKRLIESGISVNIRESVHECSALHLAVIIEHMEMLEYLLSVEGVEVDARCSEGRTPLYLAAGLGYIEIVQKLIQAGADLNAYDNDCNPVLFVAVYHPEICHLLLRLGALIHVEGSRPNALHVAVENECPEAVHMLLYYNADANITDENGCTPFMIAIMRNFIDIQEALLDYVIDFNFVNYDVIFVGSTLYYALDNNSPFINDIIERGANINYVDDLVWFLDYVYKVPMLLRLIIGSDNLEIIINFFSKGENYSLFVHKFAKRGLELDQLTGLTCRLLEFGFRASSYDIHAIFSHYGYCELFRILLYMDNNFIRGWLPKMAFVRLIFDINYYLENIVNDVNSIPKETTLQLLDYCVCSRLTDALTLLHMEDESMSAILRRLPRVPLLVELARNTTRKHIWQSFKISNNCQFYTTIDHLDIPTIYKNILTFRRKVYRVK